VSSGKALAEEGQRFFVVALALEKGSRWLDYTA
jgi:hypothetical protein